MNDNHTSLINETKDSYFLNMNNAFTLFQQAKKILITTHINPDGDALGSALALYFYLIEKNKTPLIVMSDDVPSNLKFLNASDKILKFEQIKDQLSDDFDLIACLDLNEGSRLGLLENFVCNSQSKKILIDHHKCPKLECDIIISQDNASSTGEIIWDLINLDKEYNLSKDFAYALYTAIMADTGSFRFPATSPKVFKIAAKLVEAGADPTDIYDHYYNINSLNKMKLFGFALASIETFYNNKLCIMTLTQEDFIRTGAKEDDVENFVETLLTIDGVKIGILLTDFPGKYEIKMSFRAKDSYEVRSLAVQFGGGGHLQAAGARVKSVDISQIKKELILKTGNFYKF